MEEAEIRGEIRSSKIYCAVAKDIVAQLRTQARQQGVSVETLINLWLQEKVTEVAQGT
jgi:predicted HicB family RNase H-like nuclease